MSNRSNSSGPTSLIGKIVAAILAVLLAIWGGSTVLNQNNATGGSSGGSNSSGQIGVQTKSSHCQVNGAYPDTACTPGAVFTDVTVDQICTPGYSSSVRNVPTSEKNQAYAEYGITSHTTGQYEVDHLISLELGGSNDIANLWPEAAEPHPGFHEKDKVENYLHDQVCNGAISLQVAQREIATDWLTVYQQMPSGISYSSGRPNGQR
jgi:hypothetical protein